ncbi:phage shock protein C (PspC) family protein [Gelidibacter sediminis]|uniref:Phage shock protein C (PspC) family protein n=1 Tax=Gelidibacter sediminis TaxID=1608710 RepID=A0A4R7PXB9_9FLAO|nr:PspC domain-containing protein [Gelidibacter sediminis]TDU39578.1 phage shock protein C (PspC) family protein [Gelidibacter sediminis]
MNKTVNINLAGIFFHIDEDAYLKLQRYLEAIKRSFTDSQGRSEIVADIEARIAELFNERVKNDKQVIRIQEVDEVISIMGQPEDYLVDDEIFEDEPQKAYQSHRQSTTSKKLFRDTDNSYIGGVSSGLGHYLGVDAIWMRLLWILLALGTGGTFIFIYILFWILVPEARTTAEKLTMTGEPVNISNIEKKIKDGFDNVSEAVKSIDLPKHSSKIKSSSKTFFDTLGDLIMFIFKIFAKFIGIMLILIGASTLIGLIIAFFSVGVADVIEIPGIDFLEATNAANVPIWLMSLMLLFAIGIPFFFLFYLGLKILVNNLKSIGSIAKFSLFGLWLMALIGLIVIGVKQASEYAEDAIVQRTETMNITAKDTLYVSMVHNNTFSKQFGRNSSQWRPIYDENDRKLLYLTDVELILKPTKDTVASIRIDKNSRGNTYQNAKIRAEKINYNYKIVGNRLELDGYLTTAFKNKFRDQEVEITLYLPEGTVLFADQNTHSFHRNRYSHSTSSDSKLKGHYLQMVNEEMKCLDCPEEFDLNIDNDTPGIRINENGISIKNDTDTLEINQDGIKSSSNRVKVNIDSNGINITTDNE